LDNNPNQTLVAASIPLMGKGANDYKNAVSCIPGSDTLPNFVSSTGWTASTSCACSSLDSFASPLAVASYGILLIVLFLTLL